MSSNLHLMKYKIHNLHNLLYRLSVISIGIGRYGKIAIGNLSVSADMKIGFIGDYRYRQIWKKAYRSYTGIEYYPE